MILAPVQWGVAFVYFRYWYLSPKCSVRRLVGWAAVFVLNIIVPIAFYRLNARASHPDLVVTVVVFVDGVVFIIFLLRTLRLRSKQVARDAANRPPKIGL